MAEQKFISKFDGTTSDNLLDVINKNQGVFPFDTELNETSSKGLPNSVIAKEINAIKDATSNNKGYFLTEEALMSIYPSANEGSKAYVGSNYPYKIYLYQSGLWTDSGQTGGDDSFNAGEFYTKTQIDQQHEAINNEISRVKKGANYEVLEYEVNIATTRLKVKENNRKGGYMITYNPGTGWIKEQYIGTAVTNEEWVKDENWKAEVLDENIQAIAENAQQQANLAATQAAYAKEQGDLAAQRGGVGKVDPNSDGTGEIFNDYKGNKATGNNSHAEGYNTRATGQYSHAEGYNTTAGSYSHAEGNYTTASGSYSHAEGHATEANGNYSHAEGQNTEATGNCSHAEGRSSGVGWYYLKASGDGSHAEGYVSLTTGGGIEASGKGSHAEGFNIFENCKMIAQGDGSHIQNVGTVAKNYGQTSMGCFNEDDEAPKSTSYDASKPALIIGNGTSSAAGNAFKVLFNGKTFADGEYSSAGADYAEMFEWKDGNPNNEDRVGRFVTLKGKNIEIANETSTYILGIVSGAPTIIGDNPMRWQGKYLNDEWGRPIYEDIEVTYTEYERQVDGTFKEVEKTRIDHVRKLNPLYNAKEKYVPRAERQEWDFIGMMGKLLVRQDGTLTEGGFCKSGANGIATASDSGYYVMEVINNSQALILFR